MMRLYRGQIALVLALILFGAGIAGMWLCGWARGEWITTNGLLWLIAFMASFVASVLGLALFAMAYMVWVPKWERIEKRTGRFPGEKEEA